VYVLFVTVSFRLELMRVTNQAVARSSSPHNPSHQAQPAAMSTAMFTARAINRALAPRRLHNVERRRFASAESALREAKAKANAFVKEREEVKKHASESSGVFLLPRLQS
jgi:hypothetical protein